MFRTSISSVSRTAISSRRCLHSTPVAAKTVTEKVSEVADNINKSLGKGLAGAIDKGENATEVAKDTLGLCSLVELYSQLTSLPGSVKEKGAEHEETATEKARELGGQASEKASEVSSKAGDKTSEYSAQAKQKANQVSSFFENI